MTWTDVGDFLRVAGSVATGGAACVGAYVAVRGLRKWQEETIGKRRTEIAEHALAGFLHIRRVLDGVRSRAFRVGEGSTRSSDEHEGAELKRRRDRYFAVLERLGKAADQFAELDKIRYVFEAYFGNDAASAFRTIDEIYNEIVLSADLLIQIAVKDPTIKDREREMPLRNILGWGEDNRPDDIDRKLGAAVNAIEQICRPVLAERALQRAKT